ncbi:MAG: citryl-CoA lyase [Geminicoccaceae bacterium]|nr:citryl-CoA lyase [Geminicoccaceae bacterium]
MSGNSASEDWWRTSIIEMQPGMIRYHGYAIEELIGRISFPAMIWLMLKGELPTDGEADLLGTALMAAVDHGPQAPSIAIARMAMTCGVGINNAMASAINVLGDVHGGAGEQAVSLYNAIAARIDTGAGFEEAVGEALERERYVPGFGHRFHPVDPRAPRLMQVVRDHAAKGTVSGRHADIAEAVEAAIERRKGRRIPMNIDGATAVIYAELGFPPELCRGLFVLSRSVGAMAHAFEQMQQGGRNKGPIPRNLIWTYDGPPERQLSDPA